MGKIKKLLLFLVKRLKREGGRTAWFPHLNGLHHGVSHSFPFGSYLCYIPVMKKQASLILYNIRSTYNVGAIFRTADACGVSKIYLTGYTPAPMDKFGRESSGVAKSALGAEKNIAWEKVENISLVLNKFKKIGCQIIAIEQDKNSIDYKKVKLKDPCVFIFGEEVNGITKSILGKCDVIAEIPMRGKKESLNVSVSAGIALYRMLNI